MSYQDLATFLIIISLLTISPGASSILVISHGLSHGWRKTSMTIAGQQTGLMLIMIIVGAGTGSMLDFSLMVLPFIKILGATWIIYLGCSKWRAPVIINNLSIASSIPQMTARQRFITGFLTDVANPKTIVFMMAIMPQFISPSQPLWRPVGLMTIITIAIDSVMLHIYAFAASSMQRFFLDVKMIKIQNRFLGGVLIFIGVGMLFSGLSGVFGTEGKRNEVIPLKSVQNNLKLHKYHYTNYSF